MRVLLAVTHLLGAGHLIRAAALARAFAAAGHRVTLVSGGRPTRLIGLEGIDLVQLPPVQTGTDFKALLDENGDRIRHDRPAARRELLIRTLRENPPDVLITELFPFGRRVLADEFLALLDAAHAMCPRPLVACSVRDILVAPRRADRIAETHKRLLRLYDLVLVHGDPDLAPLDASWPLDERVRPLLRYTGYVDDGQEVPVANVRSGILVSGGSSMASLPLYRAAIGAARLIEDQPWRILVGNGVPEADFEALRADAPPHATLERARPDFRALLGSAALSVSQVGYNTGVDLLRSGASSVLVPFETGNETEQRLRAERLKARGLAVILSEEDLSPDRLAEAVREGLELSSPSRADIALDGAANSVAMIEGAVRHAFPSPNLHHEPDWAPLHDALKRARDAGWKPAFWWRDDDAAAATPQFDRLLELSRRYEAGLGLAVIPRLLEPSLVERLQVAEGVFPLVHGYAHVNHAPPGEKKAEFGIHRSQTAIAAETAQALDLLRTAFGPTLVPAFVPPWNRFSPDLPPLLRAAGYCGLSGFNDRAADEPVPGLIQVNTHIDPIDWHGSRRLHAPDLLILALARVIDRRTCGQADRREPIGLLTHHLVHDEAIWSFSEALMDFLSRNRIPFILADRVFSTENGTGQTMLN